MTRPQSLRGADLTIMINNQVFGVATSASWESSTGAKAIYGIDQVIPFEIAPGPSSVSGSVNCWRLHDSAGLEGAGVMPVEQQLPRARYFDIQLVDRVTGTVFVWIPKAMAVDQRWQVESKSLVSGSFNFKGIGYANEF